MEATIAPAWALASISAGRSSRCTAAGSRPSFRRKVERAWWWSSPAAVSKRILIADDDESIRETVEMGLSDEGYEVRTARDGRTALSLAREWRPDVILLDMKMPVMDGWAFAAAYRHTPEPRASIIVVTAAQDAARWA